MCCCLVVPSEVLLDIFRLVPAECDSREHQSCPWVCLRSAPRKSPVCRLWERLRATDCDWHGTLRSKYRRLKQCFKTEPNYDASKRICFLLSLGKVWRRGFCAKLDQLRKVVLAARRPRIFGSWFVKSIRQVRRASLRVAVKRAVAACV